MSPDQHRHSVTAIIVAHDGSRWLPEALEALRSQTRLPDRIVAVDNDSRDRSASMLVEEFGADRVLTLPRDTSFGAAVAKAIEHAPPSSPTGALEAAGSGAARWIWLLHDDLAPAPDALERLLDAVQENRYAAVLGPKLRDWLDRRVLLEAGITIDGSGRRETGLEQREFDQGQHDGVHEVLAVNTAGMLVRRDVWDALGGFAPELPFFRDDVDFGWRVNASGHRVLAVTDAVAYHAEAASRRRRRLTAVGEHPRRVDRRNALFVLLVNLPGRLAIWAAIRNLVSGLLRVLLFLLAKQPGNAWDEVVAYTSIVGRPARWWRVRQRRRRGPRRSYRLLRKLMPPRWQGLRRLADMVGGFVSSKGPVDAGRHHAADTGPLLEEEHPLTASGGMTRRLLREPGVLLFLVLTAVALVAGRGLLIGGRLGGGALLPVSGGASDLWQEYLSGWHTAGLGNDVPAPPYVAVLALLATILLGKTGLAVEILLLGCVPLAGVSAYLASGWVVSDRRIRIWAAVSYALLPVATGAVAAGRFGTAVAFVLLPLIGALVGRMLRLGRRKATRAAWGAGGVLAVASAFVPLAWLLSVAVGTVAYRVWGRGKPGFRGRLAIVLLIPPALLLPWTLRVVVHPGLFLREAGLPALETAHAIDALPALMLQPGGPGMPPLWVTAGLVAAGLAALARRERRTPIVAGWTLALLAMAAGVLISRVQVAPPAEGDPAAGWPGVCMALAGAGIILAAAVGAEGLIEKLGGRWLRRRSWTATGLALLACSAPVAAAGAWISTGVTGPLDRTNPSVLPAFIAAQSSTGTHPRTLVLRSPDDGRVSYTVLRASSLPLGSSETPAPPGVTDRVASVVAGLASGRHAGEVQELATHGIRYVVMPGPLDPDLVATLDANPKLAAVSKLRDLAIWRLEAPASRLRVLSGSGGHDVTALPSGRIGAEVRVPEGSGGRTLMLAESADPGWHATLNGKELPDVVVRGWAQGFTLPPSGGQLVLSYSSARGLWVLVQALAVVVVVVLAVPGGGQQTDGDVEPVPRRDRRRSRRAPRRARGHRAGKRSRRAGSPGADAEDEALAR